MHQQAEDIVEQALFVAALARKFLRRRHGVNDDAESDEERVLGEEEDDEEAVDVAVRELVDCQVEDDERLEAKQALGFAPSSLDPGASVEVKAADHVKCHHAALKDNPSLLESVSQGSFVLMVIEVILRNVLPLAHRLNCWGGLRINFSHEGFL